MDMSSSSMSSSTMNMTQPMTLFFGSSTALYSMAWMPTNSGQYAGTCIFLVVLAIVFRGLLAAKAFQEARWLNVELRRRYVTVVDRPGQAESIASDVASEKMVLSSNGREESVFVVRKTDVGVRPWRVSVDPARAAVDTVIAGVGYLLMLAVMTMNAGYFLSILAGTFIGSLVVGRFAVTGH